MNVLFCIEYVNCGCIEYVLIFILQEHKHVYWSNESVVKKL